MNLSCFRLTQCYAASANDQPSHLNPVSTDTEEGGGGGTESVIINGVSVLIILVN